MEVRIAALAATLALADDAVLSFVELEFELHLHFGGAGVDQLVDGARSGAAPQRPGDGVQQRGFAVAVVAAEHGDVDALEAEGLVDLRIRHEVSDVQRQRDHAGSGIWDLGSGVVSDAASCQDTETGPSPNPRSPIPDPSSINPRA